MGELGSIWLYQEDADVLKQKLQNARLELEAVRLEATVTKEQTKVSVKRLESLLQLAYKERDDAREHLKTLLYKINPKPAPSSTAQNHLMNMMIPNSSTHLSDDSNLYLKQQKANSSITESNTLSETYTNLNTNSYGSSPVDSIYDAVTSPELSTMNSIGDSGNNVGFVNSHLTFVHDMNQGLGQTHSTKISGSGSGSTTRPDFATTVIDGLVKGKVLPQKGKLLEAVMDAGQLLQTLMLAGPLPSWRNPPPLQPFKIPQVAGLAAGITGSDYSNAALSIRPVWSSNHFAEMTCGSSSQMETHSMLNFGSGGCNNRMFMSTITPPQMVMMNMNNQIATGKRQRLL